MPVMKILPFTFNKISNQRNNSSRQSSPIKPPFAKDTVSFKSSDYINETLKDVDEVIKNDLEPFMADSKNLYFKVGKVGLNAQQSLDVYKDCENDLMQYKMGLADDSNNPLFVKTQEYLDLAKQYENNVMAFDRLSAMSGLENYNTPQIKKEIKELKTLTYAQNEDLKIIKLFASAYDDNKAGMQSLFDNVTLKNENIGIAKRMEGTQKRHTGAIYYMMMNPYSEAQKVIKERKDIEQAHQNKSCDMFTLLKRMDKLQQGAQKIAESTKLYYENKDKIEKFVDFTRHYELLTPTPEDLKKEYAKLKADCREIAKKNHKDFEKSYAENYELKLSEINFVSVKEILKEQSEKGNQIQSLIDNIKQEIINKNNEEFMKNYGYDENDSAAENAETDDSED